MRKAFDWKHCRMSMLEVEAVPHSCIPYVQIEEVEVNLRLTVSRPVCLGVRHPSETRDQFFFLIEN
jgi:hypothetical protein